MLTAAAIKARRVDRGRVFCTFGCGCFRTEHPMDPIKRPKRYAELADPQARPRYTGISTFFRTPHTESLGEVDIGVIGVPFDGGVTNRTGTRHGPRAVRDQSSLLRRINPATRFAP